MEYLQPDVGNATRKLDDPNPLARARSSPFAARVCWDGGSEFQDTTVHDLLRNLRWSKRVLGGRKSG